MLHLHFLKIALITFEFLTLIASIFLLIYVNKHQLSKWYQYTSKGIITILSLIILSTFVHSVVYHFHKGHHGTANHKEFYEKHHMQQNEKHRGGGHH